VWLLWRGTATMLCLLRSTQRCPFWQLAPTTGPQSCGAFQPMDREQLVWQLWRGTSTVFGLLRSTQRRPFWQLAPATTPQSCGNNLKN